jgi:hypothetical protein
MQASHAQRKTLFQVFIDLSKAYDTLDRGRTLDIIKGYGVGVNIIRLLKAIWDSQAIVAHQAGYHSRAFSADRGVTQGDIPSQKIFNIVLDAIIREW